MSKTKKTQVNDMDHLKIIETLVSVSVEMIVATWKELCSCFLRQKPFGPNEIWGKGLWSEEAIFWLAGNLVQNLKSEKALIRKVFRPKGLWANWWSPFIAASSTIDSCKIMLSINHTYKLLIIISI